KPIEVELDETEKLDKIIGPWLRATLVDDVELLDGASQDFDLDKVRHGRLSPVFFGSALTNFGIEQFLENFLKMTSAPLSRHSDKGDVNPGDDEFSAFVFKIQANMNKAHRDRIAFMRICSGKFEKGCEVFHVQGGKKVKLQSQQMMAEERESVNEAFAGDIIGVFDPGIFSIGDTLCASEKTFFKFDGIPTFAPEHFALVTQVDTMKRKQFVKGITQIAQEGAIQIFKELGAGFEEVIVGVVGTLQFEVLEYRLKNEYNVDIRMNQLGYQYIRWVENKDIDPKKLSLTSDTKKIEDLKGNLLLIFVNRWGINWAVEHNKGLILSEFNRD
ncbi:MAG: EF-Tu/IF-2/RF-3 family GTPase, partial [Oscillospiraceae bacterium]